MRSLNALAMMALTFLDCVWQLVAIVWATGKMLPQQLARLPDRMYDSVGEALRLEVRPHRLRQRLPKRLAALLVHASVSDDRELLGARRNEDKNGVAFPRLRHPQSLELGPRIGHRVGHITALDENADLARSCLFRGGNRLSDTIVFQFAQEFPCAHKTYQLDPAPPPPKLPPPPLNPLKPPPPLELPPPPPNPPMYGPPHPL